MSKAGKKKSMVHKFVVMKGVDEESKTTWHVGGSEGCGHTKKARVFQATKLVDHLMTCFKTPSAIKNEIAAAVPRNSKVQDYKAKVAAARKTR